MKEDNFIKKIIKFFLRSNKSWFRSKYIFFLSDERYWYKNFPKKTEKEFNTKVQLENIKWIVRYFRIDVSKKKKK